MRRSATSPKTLQHGLNPARAAAGAKSKGRIVSASKKRTVTAQWARWYAAHGFPVFPLHSATGGACSCGDPECQNPGKHPRTEHGFKDATTDPEIIAAWWERWPDANIGIPTGAPSGLLVVDCDPRNGGPADRSEIIERFGPIPDTAEAETGGGGRHYFFRGGGPVPKQLAPGSDLKGDGGYVVVPPSVHASGKRYRWDGIAGANALLNLADPPPWLLESIAAAGNGAGRARTESAADPERIPEGRRNDTLTSLGGTMRRRGMSGAAIEAALLEENRLRCDPPLTEKEVKRIAASIAAYKPAAADNDGRAEAAGTGCLITRRLSDIEAKPVSWLWPHRIARGKLTILAGNPGLGKSQVCASVAAIVTTGGCWPADRRRCAPGDVLFLSAEDDPADTLRPRLEAAGVDLDRVHIVDGVIRGYRGDGAPEQRMFCLAEDLRALESTLSRLRDGAALFVDPITAYLGETDSHKNAEVRGLLAPLAEIAARYNAAIIGVSHLNKAGGAEALMRVTGSLAFVAAARAAYLVAADPEDKARRLFLPLKNNLGPDATGLAFGIEPAFTNSPSGLIETSRVKWEPDPVSITADDVMQTTSTKNASALDEATDWLRETLAEEAVGAEELYQRADAYGIAKRTLKRAARQLGIKPAKAGMEGGWSWSLPKGAKTCEECQ